MKIQGKITVIDNKITIQDSNYESGKINIIPQVFRFISNPEPFNFVTGEIRCLTGKMVGELFVPELEIEYPLKNAHAFSPLKGFIIFISNAKDLSDLQ